MSSTRNPFVRDVVAAMQAYSLARRPARSKLDQNESPFDFAETLKQEVMRRVMVRCWNRYPDRDCSRLRAALADAYGVGPEGVLVGNGSNELLWVAMSTFVEQARRVIFPRPTFYLYEKLVTLLGGETVPVPIDLRSGRLPLESLLSEIERSPAPPVVVICSPNNPTGGVLPAGGLDALLHTGALVLLDRAYGEFVPDLVPALHPRLVCFSTFSKAWGLAGLRIGFAISTPEVCHEMEKVRLPYSLDLFSEEAALVALENRSSAESMIRHVVAERSRVFRALQKIDGITPYPSNANFIAFAVDADAACMFEALCASGVLVRRLFIENTLRVSIGTREDNDRFLSALAEEMNTKGAMV